MFHGVLSTHRENMSATERTPLDQAAYQRHHVAVLFNSGTGLGGPNKKADSRLAAIFTSVINTIGAPSMAGSGGGVLARAGSFLPVRQPCHLPASPLGGEEPGFTLKKEAIMPSIPRALSRLFPVTRRILAVFPSQSDALHYARERVAEGHRVQVLFDHSGFAVRLIGGAA